jgi:hypothetical protein
MPFFIFEVPETGIESDSVNIIIAIEYTEFKWKTVDFMFGFDFSKWIDDHNKLLNGNDFVGAILETSGFLHNPWIDDVFDIH